MKIFILHPGKANYPEISAYRSYFKDKFEVLDGTIDQYKTIQDKESTILWCIMGFYPIRIAAKYVIHDYRSLSVGRFPRIKDKVKRFGNTKPALRIFQNDLMEKVMGFNDKTPSLLLPMGVPDWIFDLKPDPDLAKGTYCYIGEISLERGMDKVIEAFISNMPNDQTFVLVGQPEQVVYENYKGHRNIIFTGKVPQRDALKIVLNCDYAVCRFPRHYPHCYQAPTKYLEYAALGKTILCNDSPSNKKAFEEITSNAIFVDDSIFCCDLRGAIVGHKIVSTPQLISIEWGEIIKRSEVAKHLESIV